MKKISFAIVILISCVIISAVLFNNLWRKNESITINPKEVKYIEFVSLPVPPKYKVVNKENDIAKIADFLSNLKLKTYSKQDINGWNCMLKFRLNNDKEKDFTVVDDNIIRYNNKFYYADSNVENFLKELYENLEYEELDWMNK